MKRRRGSVHMYGPKKKHHKKRHGGQEKKAINLLAHKSSMTKSGHLKVHKSKKYKISKKFRQKVKQATNKAPYGVYKRKFIGCVGNFWTPAGTAPAVVVTTTLNASQRVAYVNGDGDPNDAYSLFNCLFQYSSPVLTPAADSPVIPGADLNHFTPSKIMDAASVLWNQKVPAINGHNDPTVNLSTIFNPTTGALTLNGYPGNLKIEVVRSYAKYTMKNLSSRPMEIVIWECTPKLKFNYQNPAEQLAYAVTLENSTATSDASVSLYNTSGSLSATPFKEAMFDPKYLKGWQYKT
jgi:hypothetical protein